MNTDDGGRGCPICDHLWLMPSQSILTPIVNNTFANRC
jgi:hypothetical protein